MAGKMVKWMLTAAVALGLSGAANAALLSDDFEGVAGTAAFPAGTKYYPSSSVWSSISGGSEDTAVYQSSAAPVFDGNQAIRLAKANSSPMIDGGFAATDTVELSFAFFVPDTSKNMRTLNMMLRRDTKASGVATQIGPYLSLHTDGTGTWGLGYFDGGYSAATFHTLVIPTIDVWNTVTLRASTDEASSLFQRFVIDVNGVAYDNNGEGYKFFEGVDHFGDLYVSNSGGKVYLDNIVVSEVVPEPVSLSLLLLGGLAIIRRKK